VTDRAGAHEERVLVLAPTPRDAALCARMFEDAGVMCSCCDDLAMLQAEIKVGAGAILLPEEAVTRGHTDELVAWLGRQPPWSDLPVLIMARPGADSGTVAEAMDRFGNVTVLERPIRVTALVSAARTALRARQRQYEARRHLAQIERSALELIEADHRKDEFLAVLAHELRNPLAPIRNSLSILQLTASGDSQAERIHMIIERQVDHIVRLVDDLMDVSRITRGKITLRKQPIELGTALRGAMELSRQAIEAAHHELTLELPSSPLIVEGDAVRLAQVFANLLNNAAKYTADGGRIQVVVGREDDVAVISVRDNGSGISREMLPHVFELFVQDRQPANRVPSGLGIGLTLARRLVELHAGSVVAHSEGPGRGSEFVVRLPLAAALTAGIGDERVARGTRLAARRILVVDDNHDAASSLGRLLEVLGADVRVACDGREALEALDTFRPSVIVLDIGMPGMDGHEVARRVRQLPGGGNTMLIALTGWGQEEDRRRSQAAGFDHHLVKPADIGALQALLAALDEAQKDRVGT